MRTIGLIGGMSWESTALYYATINREIGARLGGLHSAALHVASLDFAGVAAKQHAGDWQGLAQDMVAAARTLQAAGAQCVLIGANTMHRVAPEVEAAVDIPLLHVADATAAAIRAARLRRVALLGTRFTMEQPFYRQRLAQHGIDAITPDEGDRAELHRIIYDELCRGQVLDASRALLGRIVARSAEAGAQGVVLGCTELPLLLAPDACGIPAFDTTRLHALAAVDFALGSPPR